jgi:SAM-dependent methyltransferase
MENMDITDLKLQNNRFSLVWCSHVLEHIEDDRKAMAELFRVLRPSGLAVILVPIYGDKTYEDPNIQSPEERLRHFKQEDHVRSYGSDIESRLVDAGSEVDVLRVSDIPARIVTKHALEYPTTKELFLCSKPRPD